jgi:hypothetical protein
MGVYINKLKTKSFYDAKGINTLHNKIIQIVGGGKSQKVV